MQYDTLLKSIIGSGGLIRRLTGSRVVEQLSGEFSVIQNRKADFVARLEDGRIFHLELQSGNDGQMPYRMLQYLLLLMQQYPEDQIYQAVLYVGRERLAMADGFQRRNLSSHYELIDIRRLNAADFLASALPEEQVLALLCDPPDPAETVRQLLRGWASLPRKRRADLPEKLMILLRLRAIDEAVARGLKMPIDVDMRESPFVKAWLAEGMRAGQAQMLRRQLECRFGVLPPWALDRLAQADEKTLESWSLRLLDAANLDDVFRSEPS